MTVIMERDTGDSPAGTYNSAEYLVIVGSWLLVVSSGTLIVEMISKHVPSFFRVVGGLTVTIVLIAAVFAVHGRSSKMDSLS